jgi:hypothetical protein
MDAEGHEGLTYRRIPCLAITRQCQSLNLGDGRLQAAHVSGPRSGPDTASSGSALKAPGSAGGCLLLPSNFMILPVNIEKNAHRKQRSLC